MDMVEEDRTAHLAPPYIQRMAGIRMQQMGMGVYFMPPMPQRFFTPAQIHAHPRWSQQQAVPRPGSMPGMGMGGMGMGGGVGPQGPYVGGPRVGPQLPRPMNQRMAGIRMQQMGMGGYFMPTMPTMPQRFFIPAQIHARPRWSQQQAVPRPRGMPGIGMGGMGMRGGVGPWGPRVGLQLPRPMNQPGPQLGGVGPRRPRVGGTRFEQQLQLPMNQPVPQPGGVGPQGPSVGGPRGGQQVPKPMIQTGPQPITMMTGPGMSQVPMVGVQVSFLLIITQIRYGKRERGK